MIICISGFHGTGKTTVGKKVAQRLNLDYYSTGQAFRDLAKEYEMNLKDFSKYVEDNPDIDKKLDHKVIQMAQRKDDIVLESLLSGYIL
ncbi:MAG: AAA family ATPase, partial [Promethearchaeati archaeon]